ncbi:MAG: DUF2163 domain-containing protein, partial [Aestuariibacter sp.]|nr:DUF2163 domain-containing protein [Aestuariibacter sp.]
MKTITSALKDHLAEEVTTLCTCWKLVRSDGVVQGFTDHVAELVVSSVTYEAATGFTPSNVKSTEDLAVDNLDVIGLLDSSGIDAGDLASGLYDYADVYIFIVNYEDLSMGTLKLRRGKLGEVTTGRNSFVAEVRGLAQQLQQTIGEVFSLTCRADLGDTRCGLNINPD